MPPLLAACQTAPAPRQAPQTVRVEQVYRVSTMVPFPRGLVLLDGDLYVLARGRVRDAGGVDGAVADAAGTIFKVDPGVRQPLSEPEPSQRVRDNGVVFAAPTEPPFRLFDRSADPPTRDRLTDRPYCTLRYDAATRNFYICAFSGIDKPSGKGSNFSKNLTDALLRFDTRSNRWYEVERHDLERGGLYPHRTPDLAPPPNGWLNGPNNCLVVGHWLYAVAKDNSVLVRYDLRGIASDADAPPPAGAWVVGNSFWMADGRMEQYHGHSMLAQRDGWLYLGFRTSSAIIRFRLDEQGVPVQPIRPQLIARFAPWDPQTGKSANLTDMAFGPEGDLYVIGAKPSRVYRFRPDPRRVFDGATEAPWADMAKLTSNQSMKSENLLVADDGTVFVTSGDAYAYQEGVGGTVYCIEPMR